ncbi:dUTP pyrophosphatase [Crangon crangon nudivirus]|uniref:dUTP diphosphatase n=1 Tax=Crangon crangon nudivirus TaxID=2880838 RepID=A0AAE8Y4T4_9VIRU|nr:dUTP pyrophosphatase [Crangon crangon nudivirus]UBZ25510.1 dUTP pyrophosphatase [Crangon crangon nudivirus]
MKAYLAITMNDIFFRKLNERAIIPQRYSEGAAGYDICNLNTTVIDPFKQAYLSTGISVRFPPGYYCRIAPRSSISSYRIYIGAGVIDQDSVGEIRILAINHSEMSVTIPANERVAQLIFEKIITPIVYEVRKDPISKSTIFTLVPTKYKQRIERKYKLN